MPYFKHRHVGSSLLIPQDSFHNSCYFLYFRLTCPLFVEVVFPQQYISQCTTLSEWAKALICAWKPCFLVRKHMVFPQPFLHLTFGFLWITLWLFSPFSISTELKCTKKFLYIMCTIIEVFMLWLVTASKVAVWSRWNRYRRHYRDVNWTFCHLARYPVYCWGNLRWLPLCCFRGFSYDFTPRKKMIVLNEPLGRAIGEKTFWVFLDFSYEHI